MRSHETERPKVVSLSTGAKHRGRASRNGPINIDSIRTRDKNGGNAQLLYLNQVHTREEDTAVIYLDVRQKINTARHSAPRQGSAQR